MIICTKCDHTNDDNDTFCGSCGAFLEWDGRKVEAPVAPVYEQPVYETVEDPSRPGLLQRVKAAVLHDESGTPVAPVDAYAPTEGHAPAPTPGNGAAPAPATGWAGWDAPGNGAIPEPQQTTASQAQQQADAAQLGAAEAAEAQRVAQEQATAAAAAEAEHRAAAEASARLQAEQQAAAEQAAGAAARAAAQVAAEQAAREAAEAERQRRAEAEQLAATEAATRAQNEMAARQQVDALARATSAAEAKVAGAADDETRGAAQQEVDQLHVRLDQATTNAEAEAEARVMAQAVQSAAARDAAEAAAAAAAAAAAEEQARRLADEQARLETEARARAQAEAQVQAEAEQRAAAEAEERARQEALVQQEAEKEAKKQAEYEERQRRAAALLAAPVDFAPQQPTYAPTPTPMPGAMTPGQRQAPPRQWAPPPGATPPPQPGSYQPVAAGPQPGQPLAPGQPVAAAPQAVAPQAVLPGQLQRGRVAPRQAAPQVKMVKPGDLVCGQCGEGNEPTRKFCRQCGSSLIEAKVQAKPGFWARLKAKLKRGPKVSKAGEKRKGPNAGRRTWRKVTSYGRILLGIIVTLGALGLALPASAGPFTEPRRTGRTFIHKQVKKVQDWINPPHDPVRPDFSCASSQLSALTGGEKMVDGYSNTFWSSKPDGAKGVNSFVFLHFLPDTTVRTIIVTNGRTDGFTSTGAVTQLKLSWNTGLVSTIDVKDDGKPQTIKLPDAAKNIETVNVLVTQVQSHSNNPESAVAITEMEFFGTGGHTRLLQESTTTAPGSPPPPPLQPKGCTTTDEFREANPSASTAPTPTPTTPTTPTAKK